jgi:hypothetical protein
MRIHYLAAGLVGIALAVIVLLGHPGGSSSDAAPGAPAAPRKLKARFPDFGFMVSPAEYQAKYSNQPVFRLKTDYPLDKPAKAPAFLGKIDFRKNPQQYIEAVRDYAFDGNLPDWDPYKNNKADWFHIPWLHPDLSDYPPNGGTEGFHGLIKEAGLSPLQLGPDQKGKDGNYSIYAITLVNDLAGYTLGKMWADPERPDPRVTDARWGGGFPVGTVFAKLLFTDAPQGTDKVAFLENPLSWNAYITDNFQTSTKRSVHKVNLLQMDIAVRDANAEGPGLTGWVFGTFVYNGQLNKKNKFMNLVPVGLMWGNDPQDRTNTTNPFPPTRTQVNPKLKQTVIFAGKDLPPQHLGWNGRLNGPADLNTTSCMSCHITAQYPQITSLVPDGAVPDGGKAPPQPASWDQWMKWFQNIPQGTSMDPRSYSTDYSFQVSMSLTNFYKFQQIKGLMADQYAQPRTAPALAAPADDAAKGIDLAVPREDLVRRPLSP